MSHCFVYIVRCSDGTLFTGIAAQLRTIVQEVNRGRGSAYTRSRLPVFLAYSEEYMNEHDAKKRQAVIQKMDREEKERLISLEHLKVIE